MVREIDLDRELTCLTCDETHTEFYEQRYNHNRNLTPIIVCERCGCGDDYWKY